MKIVDVMKREVITFREYDTLILVSDVMNVPGIPHFPVVDEEERPVGILLKPI